jgi:signal transduction histidine kinase
MRSLRVQYLSATLIAVLLIFGAAYLLFSIKQTNQVEIVKSQHTRSAQNIAQSISTELEISLRELFLFESLFSNKMNSQLEKSIQQIVRPRLEGRAVFLVNESNVIVTVFPPNKEFEGLNVSAYPFVSNTRLKNTPSFSQVTSFGGEFANATAIAAPLPNGFLLIELLPADVFATITRTYRKQAAGFVAVLDDTGTVVATSVKEQSLHRRNFQNISCVRDSIQNKTPGACAAHFLGEDGIVSIASTSIGSLSVLVFVPNSESLHFVEGLGVLFWSMLASMMLIFIAAAAILWNRFNTPIQNITQKCALVASGDLSQSAASHYTELAPLMDGFTNMVARIKTRDNDLTNALDAAATASQAKSQFLANFGHEVRTPLTTIIGVCELYKQGVISRDALNEYFSMIESSSNHLLDLISQVISLTRSEIQPMEITLEPFLLGAALDEIRAMIFPIAKKKNVSFEILLHDNLPQKIVSDPTRLRQVLTNLLMNAVKFTHEGRVTLEVSALGSASDNIRTLRFVISDTGIGMSEEFLRRMFTPFTQEDESTSKAYGGAGLGLAISHNIVRNMRGTIHCESKKRIGTTFTVEIPVRTQAITQLTTQLE